MSNKPELMSQKETDSTRILVAEAVTLIQSKKATLVDIRERDELEREGKAKGAQWLPLSEILASEEALSKALNELDLKKTLVFYCKSGGRVSRLIPILNARNITARNMGGLNDWIAAGQPVERI